MSLCPSIFACLVYPPHLKLPYFCFSFFHFCLFSRHCDNINTAGSTSRHENETKLLVKCMMECYRAHPGQVAMLLDLAAVFLYPTPMDFTFLKVRFCTFFITSVDP